MKSEYAARLKTCAARGHNKNPTIFSAACQSIAGGRIELQPSLLRSSAYVETETIAAIDRP
jgi:hypothetical protein